MSHRRVAALLLIAIALALGAGCQSDVERRDEHMARAEVFFGKRRFPEALIELRNALKLDPQNAEINFRIAEVLRYQDRLRDAIFFYREALRLDPSRTDAAIQEASLLIFDDEARAEELLDQAQARDPSRALSYVIRSRLHVVRGELEDALREALTAIELEPEEAATHRQLGSVHQAMIRKAQIEEEPTPDATYEAAIRAFDAMARVGNEPQRAEALADQAQVYASWPGHDEEAAAAWREAVDVAAGLDYGFVSQSIFPKAERFARLRENWELAQHVVEAQVGRYPNDRMAWVRLADLEIRMGGTGENAYRRMIEARPESAEAYAQYGQFLAQTGSVDQAVAVYEEGLERGDDPAMMLAAASATLRAAERYEEAEPYARRLQEEFPDTGFAVMQRARELLHEGKAFEAREELRAMIDREERADALLMLARIEERIGDPRRAIEHAERAMEVAPASVSNAQALRLRARLQARTRDCIGSLRSFTGLVRQGQALTAGERVLQAECLYVLGRARVARRLLEAQLENAAAAPDAALAIARFEGRERPVYARTVLERALAQHPQHLGLTLQLGRLDLQDGRPGDAIARVNEIFEAGGGNAILLQLRARALAARGELELAERDALQAFQANPRLAGAAALVVAIYTRQDRVDEAIASFEQARETGALPPSAQTLMARLYIRKGDLERARELLQDALEERADLPAAKNDLAWVLARTDGDLDRSLVLAQEAQQAMPLEPEVAHTLGFVYLKKGLHQPAVEQLRYAIELAEREQSVSPEFHFHLGLALRELGRSDEAGRQFEAALALDDGYEEAAAALQALAPIDAS